MGKQIPCVFSLHPPPYFQTPALRIACEHFVECVQDEQLD